MDQHPHLVTSFRPLGLFTQDLSRGTKQSGVIIRPHRHWGVRDEKNPRARIEDLVLGRVLCDMRLSRAHPGEEEDEMRMGRVVRELRVVVMNPVRETVHKV